MARRWSALYSDYQLLHELRPEPGSAFNTSEVLATIENVVAAKFITAFPIITFHQQKSPAHPQHHSLGSPYEFLYEQA